MFRTVPLSIIRSFSLCTQQWYVSYILRAGSGRNCSQAVSKPVWNIPLLCAQWKSPDDGQMNCPKHVEFYSKNKFEKLVHLIGFITRIYHDTRSPVRQTCMNVSPSYSPWIGKLHAIRLISMPIHIHNLPNLLKEERGRVGRVQLNCLCNKVTNSVNLQTERCL